MEQKEEHYYAGTEWGEDVNPAIMTSIHTESEQQKKKTCSQAQCDR
jgi:hypothetical protein